jgi:hemerythrin
MVDDEKLNRILENLFNHNVLIVWKPKYNLGIPIVDEQHRGIVTIINSLYYGMQNKHGNNVLMPINGMINEYTRIHFELEEDFLKKCNYPQLKEHKELHRELINKLLKVGKESLYHRDPKEFFDFLKEWWITHICDKDRAFLEFLSKSQGL